MALRIHDERLTRRVGAAVLVIAALVVAMSDRLHDLLGPDTIEVRVRFGEASGLREGASVVVAGHRVGEISRILIDERGGLTVVAAIERGWAARLPVNSEVFVSARSVLAPRWLELGAPPHGAAPARGLVDGDELIGVDPPDLDRLLRRIWVFLTELRLFVDAMPEVDWPATDLELPAIDLDLPSLVGLVVPDLPSPHYQAPANLDGVIAKVERLLAFAQEVLARIQGTFADALNGTGSLAMLLADLELVDDVKAMTRELKRAPWRLLPASPQER